MVVCDRQEDEDKPGLGANPEDSAKFDEGDHDDVKQRWAIELPGRTASEITATQHVLPWISTWAERGHGAIRSSNTEDERTCQDMTISGRLRAIDNNVHCRWQVWLEGKIHLFGIVG